MEEGASEALPTVENGVVQSKLLPSDSNGLETVSGTPNLQSETGEGEKGEEKLVVNGEVSSADGDGPNKGQLLLVTIQQPSTSATLLNSNETGLLAEETCEGVAEKMKVDESCQPLEQSTEEDTGKELEGLNFQITESPSSSKHFKFKQTRVRDWVESPNKSSYIDNPSFKYDLPFWVDKFKDFFSYVKTVRKRSLGKKEIFSFRCKRCIFQVKNGLLIQSASKLVTHLKRVHKSQYTKFIKTNPEYLPKPKKLLKRKPKVGKS